MDLYSQDLSQMALKKINHFKIEKQPLKLLYPVEFQNPNQKKSLQLIQKCSFQNKP